MKFENFSSRLLEEAVFEFSKLPGIGKKTALRLVLHLLKQERSEVEKFGNSIITLKNEIKHCNLCHNISDSETCEICYDKSGDKKIICVVETIKDVMSIESTQQYHGQFHILGGIISPMDGIGPKDINISSLVERIEKGSIKEIILALPTTMEGDTTNFYIFKKLAHTNVDISIIARGVSVGDELEYTDEVTLGRSIINRVKFGSNLP